MTGPSTIFPANMVWGNMAPVVCCFVWEEDGRRWYGGVLSEKGMRRIRNFHKLKPKPIYMITIRKKIN